MNYHLRQIVDICDAAPPPREAGSLADYQRRLDDFDERISRVIGHAHELQKILDGERHTHVAGTLEGKHIDTCASCGRERSR